MISTLDDFRVAFGEFSESSITETHLMQIYVGPPRSGFKLFQLKLSGFLIFFESLVTRASRLAPRMSSDPRFVVGLRNDEDFLVQPRHYCQRFIERRCIDLAAMQREIPYSENLLRMICTGTTTANRMEMSCDLDSWD
jgi:hypothetical protein